MDYPQGEVPVVPQSLQDTPHILRNIMAIIEARSDEITEKWKGYFGELRYFC